jgi:hypothetical protein
MSAWRQLSLFPFFIHHYYLFLLVDIQNRRDRK